MATAYCIWNTQPAGTVKLQGIPGYLKGTPVKAVKPGDVIMWNYGYTSTVISTEASKTGKTYTVTLRSDDSGNISPRKMGADRLVVIKEGV